MAAVVVFYSKSNNTRTGAQYLAEKTNADLIELVEKEKRNGFYGFIKSGFQAVLKKSSELLGDPWDLVSGYSDIYLMTPIWAANGTPAMNRFISNTDFTDKNVFLITLQADIKKESSTKVHNYYRTKIQDARIMSFDSAAVHSAPPGKYAGREYINSQIGAIMNSKTGVNT